MSMFIKEFVGYSTVFTEDKKPEGISLTESAMPSVAPLMISPDSLMVDIEGIHADIFTVNLNKYTSTCLENSIPLWTSPYRKPVIMHHKEEDGEIIGRVNAVEKIKSNQTNTDALLFTCNIGDDKGIQGVNNGTLSTVSIGAECFDVRCSICGKNLAEEGRCQHKKGAYYNGKLCYWIINDMEPKELSYVIVPSDKYAHNIKVYKPEVKKIKESVEVNDDMSLVDDILGVNVTESEDVTEKVKVNEIVDDKTPDAKAPEKEEPKAEEKPVEEEKEPAKEEEKKDEVKAEEEKEIKDEEKKDEEVDKKEEDKSNKEDEEEIKALKEEIIALKEEIADLKKQYTKVKEAKEKVDAELVKFKIQEKQQVIDEIISIKESIGITYDDPADMMNTYSIKELNIMHKTLKESCNVKHEAVLPQKIEKVALVDEEADNLSKSVKESRNISEIDTRAIEFENLFSKFTK